MIKVRAICPPGVDRNSLINGVVGFDGICERKEGDVFEMPDHCAEGDHPWFEIIEEPPPVEAALALAATHATEEAKGLTYSQAGKNFHTEDEIPV